MPDPVDAVHYIVDASKPNTHVFSVTLRISLSSPGPWVMQMASWTPGSYFMREFARHVDEVHATVDGMPTVVRKVDKGTWLVAPLEAEAGIIEVQYRVFAYELSVRTSHFDRSHGYINGASVFLYPRDLAAPLSGTLEFIMPEGWNVYSALDAPEPGRLHFSSIDELFDSPIELGTPVVREFQATGRPHQLILWGDGPLDLTQVEQAAQKLIPAAQAVFGGPLPYPRYVFFIHQTAATGGGLEHKNSSSLAIPRFGSPPDKSWPRFLGLMAHEYFHLWNVKRLHPDRLGPFDYQHEAYTKNLWLMEGGTDYYAQVLLGRAGLIPPEAVITNFGKRLAHLEAQPGRFHQSVTESSFDAWIKHYRPDANSVNATVSYYEKGSVVSWLLDLELRYQTGGKASLDTLLAALWHQYPDGFPEHAPRVLAEEIGGPLLGRFFDTVVEGRGDLDTTRLDWIGLEWVAGTGSSTVDLGLMTKVSDERLFVTAVLAGGPGEQAGLAPGDELLALDGYRIDARHLDERLQWYHPGQHVVVHVFRQGVLVPVPLRLGEKTPDRLLKPVASPTAAQQDQFQRWMGQPWPYE